jgi:hypothetical protein
MYLLLYIILLIYNNSVKVEKKVWPRYKTEILDEFTLLLEKIVLNIVHTADKNKKEYIIGGGLAIEFFNGRLSRNHHDIDFNTRRSDTEWWVNWFKGQGYNVVKKKNSEAKEIYEIKGSHGELLVDYWPIDNYEKWADMDEKKVTYKKTVICIEDPNRVLDSKIRHGREYRQGRLRIQDVHDFASMKRTPPLH